MICFHDKNSISIPAGAQWTKYSYPLHILQGSHETYYYAFAKNMVDIELGNISTFQNYKKEYQQNSFPKSF